MDYHPGLTYKTIFHITRIADKMANDGEIQIEDKQKLFLDVVELGSQYDFSHETNDPHYERRLTAHVRAWFLMHYPPHGEPEES